MAHTAGERLGIKILNIVVFIFFFGSNIYSVTNPESHEKISYLTPAKYAQWVWTGINFTTLCGMVYQFTENGFEPWIEGVGFRFAIIGILNGIWASLYHRGHYVIAFIFMLLLAGAVSTVYWDLKARFPPKTYGQAFFVSLPFSLWHAYSVVQLFLTGFVAFSKDKHHQAPTVATKIVANIIIVSLTFIAVGYAFHSANGDIAGAAVIAWMLLGIYTYQVHPRLIHYFALGGFIISLLAIVKAVFYTARNPGLGDDGERAPLIAGSDA